MRIILVFIILIIWSKTIEAQPTTSFSSPITACLNEPLTLTNETVNGDSYIWDFCLNDLENTPIASDVVNLSDSNLPIAITLVYDSANWFGFVSSRSSKELFRLNFGTSLQNTPSITNLGNLGGLLGLPKKTIFIKESNSWYALLIDNNGLFRLTFPNNLNSTPSIENLGSFGVFSSPNGLEVIQDNGDYYAFVPNFSNNNLSVINFGNSITNTPTALDATDFGNDPEVSGATEIKLKQYNSTWYGILSSNSNGKVFLLDFSSGLTNGPVYSEIGSVPQAAGLEFVVEGGNYYAYVAGRSNLLQILFGDSPTNTPTVTNLGNLGGVYSGVEAFTMAKDTPDWTGFSIDFGSKELTRMDFPNLCNGEPSLEISNEVEPTNLSFSIAGNYSIQLTAFDIDGNLNVASSSITVNNNIAPDISFIVDENRCIENANSFTSVNMSGDITSYSWDFNGDGLEDSNQEDALYDFSIDGVGTYNPTLMVSNVFSCTNTSSMEISLFEKPIALFSLPGGTLCSNANISFNNTSVYDNQAPISWEWNFDNESISSDFSSSFNFSTGGNKTISLTATLDQGCVSMYQEVVLLSDGPSVGFSWTNNCFGEPVIFDNSSETSDVTYLWDFGETNTSTDFEPTHTFINEGEYQITLNTTDLQGCTSTLVQGLIVSDDPLVGFSNDPGIENLPVSFFGHDLTPVEDEVISWLWDFNGEETSNEQNSEYSFGIPGEKQVSVSITTEQGCSEVVNKSINIEESFEPNALFSSSALICRTENLKFQNQSINADSYIWDFCLNDLENTPIASDVVNLSDSNLPIAITLVYDSANWFGFVSSRSSKELFRLNFGTSLQNTPSITNLGNLGGLLGLPKKTIFIKESNSWYALLIDNNGLFRLTFPNNLNSTPSIENLGSFGVFSSPNGLEVIQDNGDYYAFVPNFSNNNLSVINFGNSITNTPTALDATDLGNDPGVSGATEIKLQQYNSTWYGILSSNSNGKVFLLDFSSGLTNGPVYSEIGSVPQAAGLEFVLEGGNYYAYVAGRSNLLQILFGDSPTNTPTVTNLGNLGGVYSGVEAFTMAKDTPDWTGFSIDFGSKELTRMDFPNLCNGEPSLEISNEVEPTNLSFSIAGNYSIQLTAIHHNGNVDVASFNINVENTIAPAVSFLSDNQCIASNNIFDVSTSNIDDIIGYSWDFDTDQIEDSSEPNPSYQFQNTGTFEVSLVIQATNGCSNNVSQQIIIYPEPPTPNFEITNSTICSNTELSFSNLSNESAHIPEILSYTWDFEGVGSSTEINPSFTFETGGTKQVSLTMSIPGCESFISKNIEVIAGPDVAFQFEDDCNGSEIPFTNQTIGEGITGHLWDFNDGSTNTNSDPSHIFTQAGDYEVSLQSTNDVGCINTLSQTITVHSLPSAAFISEIGCANAPLQFNDASLVNNANITSWNWDFDGLGNSEEKDPTFTFQDAGEYEVTLISMSNFGCQETTSQMVVINQSPSVEFETTLGCLNETSSFTDLTSTDVSNPITSWFWEIDDDVSTLQNPTYIFTSSGIHDVSLTVTTANNCAIKLSKEINVLDLPEVSFSVNNNCNNEFTNFTDESISSSLIISRGWDFAGLGSANGSQATYQFPQSGSFDVTLTTVTEDLCVNTLTKSVQINESPIAGFDVDVILGAPPLEVQFTNNSMGATSYIWTFDDPENSTSTESDPKFIFNQIKDHNVSLLAENEAGCTDISFATIKVSVPELDLELVKLEPSLDDDKINLTLTIANRGTVRADGFDINIALENDLTISESFDQVLNAGEEIVYPLNFEIPLSNSNVGFVCIRINDRITDIEDSNELNNEKCANFDQQIVIENPFPNPSNDEIALKIVLPNSADLEISLTNIHGETVYLESFSELQPGLNSFLLDIRNYNQGMYFMKIQSGQTEQIRRIIKF